MKQESYHFSGEKFKFNKGDLVRCTRDENGANRLILGAVGVVVYVFPLTETVLLRWVNLECNPQYQFVGFDAIEPLNREKQTKH